MPRFDAPGGHGRQLGRCVRGFVRMIHPVPVVCVLLATIIFALVAQWPPQLPTLLRLVATMAGIQIAIGALNDYVDIPLDRQTKPWKPLVCGDLRPGTALLLTGAGLLAALMLVAPLGQRVALLALLGAGAGLIYNLALKRTRWSWLPYLVAVPLLPIWVWSALRGWDMRLLSVYPLGALMAVSLHLADTLPDIEADTQHGVRGMAHRLGPAYARLLCWFSALLPALLVVGAASAGMADLHIARSAAMLSVVLSGLAIAYYALSHQRDWRVHFALLASATITLGGGWLLALHDR